MRSARGWRPGDTDELAAYLARALAGVAHRRNRGLGPLRRNADGCALLAHVRPDRRPLRAGGGRHPEGRDGRMSAPAEQRLSIVHAIARLNVGGAALHVIELAARQRARNHDVVIVAGTLADGEESMEYVAHERGVPVVQPACAAARVVPVRGRQRGTRTPTHGDAAPGRRPPYPHGKGRSHRADRGPACPRRPAPNNRPHVPRARSLGLLRHPARARVHPARAPARTTVGSDRGRERGGS